jgi:hypothetical protein
MPPNYPDGFARAELAIDGGETIPVMFNPAEYTITKTNTWNFKQVQGKSLPPAEFGGGNPREIGLVLLLDVTLLGPGQSVRSVTDKLFQMMEVPSGRAAGGPRSAPPFITFRWGSVDTFKAACTSLTVTFQLFRPNGEPIRADVKMQLKQAEPASTASSSSANAPTTTAASPPTSAAGAAAAPGAVAAAAARAAGPPGGGSGNGAVPAQAVQGIHTVQDGDSLASIAHRAYGEAQRWRDVAEANGIDNPFHLPRGLPLTLPRPRAR